MQMVNHQRQRLSLFLQTRPLHQLSKRLFRAWSHPQSSSSSCTLAAFSARRTSRSFCLIAIDHLRYTAGRQVKLNLAYAALDAYTPHALPRCAKMMA